MATANVKAVITAEDRASQVIAGVGASFVKMASAVAVGQLAVKGITFAIDKLKDVTRDSVGAAFNQVRQVENATFALRAYEKDAGKVNKVLKELISFARSDMGTLFQREELFKAASNLRAFGVASDQITSKVKILARGVSLGMTTFDELSMIIGRVVQRGKLGADEFDMLAQRGIVLSSSFRGASVSSEKLFKELERVLPADLLKGRANTIDGMLIRLKSAFRDLGSTILGVDKDTSQFIKGGLGDMAMNAIKKLTDFLQNAETKNAIAWIGEKLREFAVFIWPIVNQAFTQMYGVLKDWIVPTLKSLKDQFDGLNDKQQVILGIAGAVTILGLAFVTNPVVASIAAIVGALLLLHQNWDLVMQKWQQVKDYVNSNPLLKAATEEIIKNIQAAGNNLSTILGGFWQWIQDHKTEIKLAFIAIGAAIVVGLTAASYVIKQTTELLKELLKWADRAFSALGKVVDFVTGGQFSKTLSALKGALRAQETLRKTPSLSPQSLKLPGFNARGTNYWRGGQTWVGEEGPELLTLPSGSKITPNDKIQSNQTTNVNITVQAGVLTGTQSDARKLAMMVVESMKDVAGAKNMSVTQLIGG